ncbi:MAG: 50S ribosomal protein L13 [Candidatus Woesearchaeota archaeon]
MAVIDASGLILGRLAGEAAKMALLGEKVNIINCEKAVISGSKKATFARYTVKRLRGGPQSGPYFPRTPEAIVKRTIRGMLPYRKPKGRAAYKSVKCYFGKPAEFEKEKSITIAGANAKKLKTPKFTTVYELSKYMGAKI